MLYVAGAVLTLLWYLVSYLRLRGFLRRGATIPPEMEAAIQRVCAQYSLTPCRAVAVPGLPSAFVCGPVRPVLALPADTAVDDKILLHELLHLKHLDALQSVLWCILRALHWCNPVLQYVFNRIGNDMESLCDQRVLERLEGEARREYGVILLDMANQRYARAPGTSSLSNGGRNISRRIAAIVRFKKYPQGMALASVCIVVVLGCSSLWGSAYAYTWGDFQPRYMDDMHAAMAFVRINRCTTIAGALDTYAKGLMQENGLILAAASSLEKHEAIEAEMRYNHESEGWIPHHFDSGSGLNYATTSNGYNVCNLAWQPDGSCTGLLVLYTNGFVTDDLTGEDGERLDKGTVLIPVTLREENGWVVEEAGSRQLLPGHVNAYSSDFEYPLRTLTASGQDGTVTVKNVTIYQVDNSVPSSGWNPFGYTTFDNMPNLNAQFNDATYWDFITYQTDPDSLPNGPVGRIMLQVMSLNDPSETVTFPLEDIEDTLQYSSTSGSSTSGASWVIETVGMGWDGTLFNGSGGSMDVPSSGVVPLPAAYQAAIFWNGVLVDEFWLEEDAA